MTGLPDFNVHKRLRRTWQDGSDSSSSVYQMSGQMFVKRTKFTMLREKTIQYPLHPWVEAASKTSSYFPNPDRTRFLEPSNGVLVNISECDPPYIRTGDLACISFFVEFIIGLNNWSTTFTPYEVIRVGTVSPDLVGDGKSGEFEPDQPREGVTAGQQFLMRQCYIYLACPLLTRPIAGDFLMDEELDDTEAADTGIPVETGDIVPNTVADSEHDQALSNAVADDELGQLMTDLLDAPDETASQALPEIFFGPEDGRLYWDKPVDSDRSPSPQTPREWPASPARPVSFNHYR